MGDGEGVAVGVGVGVGVALAEPVGVGWVAGFSSTGAHALKPSASMAAVTTASDIKAVKRGKKERSELPTDLGGDYVTQLQEFMKYFRRDQLFVMNSNHAFKETHDAMERIRQFLGLKEWVKWETDPFPHDDHLGSTNNSDDPECVFRHVPQMDCDFRDMLAAHYKDTNKVRSWPAVGRGGCSLLSVLTRLALPCLARCFPPLHGPSQGVGRLDAGDIHGLAAVGTRV